MGEASPTPPEVVRHGNWPPSRSRFEALGGPLPSMNLGLPQGSAGDGGSCGPRGWGDPPPPILGTVQTLRKAPFVQHLGGVWWEEGCPTS